MCSSETWATSAGMYLRDLQVVYHLVFLGPKKSNTHFHGFISLVLLKWFCGAVEAVLA